MVLIATGLALITASAGAQTYPTRPIKLVVPFAAGGPGDTVGRLLAQAMSKGQTVVVENVSGAGGNIGATYVSRAAPDGYTLLFHQLGMAISPFLYPKLEYDPLKSFEYIGLIAYQANVLVTRPKAMPERFSEFLAYLKDNHEKLSFASTGPGGASDLCAILFKSHTGLDIKTVPYRATAPALTDVIAGNVDLLCDSVATATPYIQAGTVRAYGVTTATRASSLPDVPTLDEQGLKGFDQTTWTALYAPKGTPAPVVEHLVKSLQDAVQDPQFKASLERVGSAAWPKESATPQALSAMLHKEMARWGPILKAAKPRGN
jgi:tripartite-type tricarboxylate transporter receptor subunit TctC